MWAREIFMGVGLGRARRASLWWWMGGMLGSSEVRSRGGYPSRRQEEQQQACKVPPPQYPAAPEIFDCRRIALASSRVAEPPPAERELEAVGRNRMEVPAGLELSVVGRHLDPHSIAR